MISDTLFGSGVSSHSDWGEAVSSDVSLVDGGIAFAFLHLAPETVGNRIHNPSGDVLCGRIERKHIVQHRVVRRSVTISFIKVKSVTIPSELSLCERHSTVIIQLWPCIAEHLLGYERSSLWAAEISMRFLT